MATHREIIEGYEYECKYCKEFNMRHKFKTEKSFLAHLRGTDHQINYNAIMWR